MKRNSPSAAALRFSAVERRLLLAVTSLPTAAGKESAIQQAIDAWAASLGASVRVRRDRVGNALVSLRKGPAPKLLITAHLDHPAFVVHRAVSERELELEFRGGVHDPYFERAEIEVFDAGTGIAPARPPFKARITSLDSKAQPFKRVRAMIGDRTIDARSIAASSIARWSLPPAEITKGELHTHACDDLAAVAASMILFTRLVRSERAKGVGLLFTVAEEVGFLGAIFAATSGIIPRGATLLCLENSRSFPHDSPIGAGAILRVGDRLSVFTPTVTNALTQLYQQHATKHAGFKWQRKLMPGGACEATAFAALGHASTCLCLPLGNYHNMCDIDGVLAGKRPARIGREFVALSDVESLIAMLQLAVGGLASPSQPRRTGRVGRGRTGRTGRTGQTGRTKRTAASAATAAGSLGDFRPMMEKLWRERSKSVLGAAMR